MSISYNNFKKGNFNKRRISKLSDHPVIIFLMKNKKSCYTVKDIQKETKILSDSIRSALRKAKKQGLIEHRQPYFHYKK